MISFLLSTLSSLLVILTPQVSRGKIYVHTAPSAAMFDRNRARLCVESLAYQHVRSGTRFRQHQNPSVLDLVFTRFHEDITDLEISAATPRKQRPFNNLVYLRGYFSCAKPGRLSQMLSSLSNCGNVELCDRVKLGLYLRGLLMLRGIRRPTVRVAREMKQRRTALLIVQD